MRRLAAGLVADRRALDAVLLGAYLDAYRTLPGQSRGFAVEAWLAGVVEAACAGAEPRETVAPNELWARLADGLAAEAPALAPPELPQRRFPVVPGMQRRPRRKGPG
jgi:hypothetical protein